MKDETFKGKFTSFCRKIGKRNMIIAASFIVVAVALIIGVSAFSRQDDGFDYSQGVGLDQTEQSTEQSGTDSTESAADSYFFKRSSKQTTYTRRGFGGIAGRS